MMKIKLIVRKIVLFVLSTSSIFLFSCSCKNKTNNNSLDFLDSKYIEKNIENDLISYLAEIKFGSFQKIEKIYKENEKVDNLFFEKYPFYKGNIGNVFKFYEKVKEKIYEEIYEEIKNKNFQDDYLFNEEKFAQKLINDGFNIKKTNYKQKIIPTFKSKNEKWENFIETSFENFYAVYNDYIIKKIVPKIYCIFFIIEYIKENEKNSFGTSIQAYKINSISIPKGKGYNTEKEKSDFLNIFLKNYVIDKVKLNHINNIMTGLESKEQTNSKLLDQFKTKEYTLVTNEDGSYTNQGEKIKVHEGTLIDKLNDNNYLKESSYKKNIRIIKNKILEERKIRLENFVKSGWYIKNDLSFGIKINEFLKDGFSNKNIQAIKNKKNDENIKCLNQKCFFKKDDNIANDENVFFYDEENFYIIEIEDTISNINKEEITKIEEISENILKSNDNYNKYKKKVLEYSITNKNIFLNFKKKEICNFFEKNYSDSFNKKIKCTDTDK